MNNTIDRTLTRQQWDDLRYPINLRALTEAEGGGWFVTIPLLGEATCAADGETVEEALANLEAYRRSLYEAVIASRHPIPLPSAVTEQKAKPAGKWLMRASSELHAKLQKGAQEAGVSFNTYCIECLSRGHDAHAAENAVREGILGLKSELIQEIVGEVREQMLAAARGMGDGLSDKRVHQAFLETEVEMGGLDVSFSSQPSASLPKPHLCLVDAQSQMQAA